MDALPTSILQFTEEGWREKVFRSSEYSE